MKSGIVIFGGTTEGRKLAECFANTAVEVYVCVATEYGKSLVMPAENVHIVDGRMDEVAMEHFFVNNRIQYCLDATHPYATLVTENIRMACKEKNISYIRVKREEQVAVGNIVFCDSVAHAAEYLKDTTGKVLITTGSKELEEYCVIPDYKNRCVARVLPTAEVLEKCEKLGFVGKNLIAMQGPFDYEMNVAFLKQTDAKYMVTKSSGKEGGFAEKCEAANAVNATLLVIGRPVEIEEGILLSDAIKQVCDCFEIRVNRKYSLIGMGPGDWNLLTSEAIEKIDQSDIIIGARRIVEICQKKFHKPFFVSYKQDEILKYLEEHPEYAKIALVYSGDVSVYSGAKKMAKALQNQQCDVEMISGISSIEFFLNYLHISFEDVNVCSCHGKDENLIEKIAKHRNVVTLVGEEDFLKKTAEKLMAYGMESVQITVGERLSYPDMSIQKICIHDALDCSIDKLSVVLFENTDAKECNHYVKDEEFIRGSVPMTKEEVRILSVEKLELNQDSIVYDVGAGTGSVAVQMAKKCPLGQVYAIEKKAEGIELIRTNKKKHQVDNLCIVEGTAPDAMDTLPAPSHVFIGGSDGKLGEIIEKVRSKNLSARFVINAVTMETISSMMNVLKQYPEYEDAKIISVQISKGKLVGSYHLMEAQNPIYIICFGGK